MHGCVRRVEDQSALAVRSRLGKVAGAGQVVGAPELRGGILGIQRQRLVVQPVGLDPVAAHLVKIRKHGQRLRHGGIELDRPARRFLGFSSVSSGWTRAGAYVGSTFSTMANADHAAAYFGS